METTFPRRSSCTACMQVRPLGAARELQREFQLRIARRQIAGLAPALSLAEVELAWRVGVAEQVDAAEAEAAAAAYVELARSFERRWGRAARSRAARDLARLAPRTSGAARARILGQALRLDPAFAAHAVRTRRRRRELATLARREAEPWLARLEPRGSTRAVRVTAVFPEPTPYRVATPRSRSSVSPRSTSPSCTPPTPSRGVRGGSSLSTRLCYSVACASPEPRRSFTTTIH